MIIECTKDGFEIVRQVNWLPPINKQARKKYKWLFISETSALCSVCNRKNILYGDYCKWCGEKMIGSED